MSNLLQNLQSRARIAVINVSGNAGKTTSARHLIAPRLNAKIISVESINGDEFETDAIKGRQFGQLMEAIAVMDGSIVCDVGASNAEVFIGKMQEYAGSHEDFDYYVVPCVPDKKQIRDTITTIEALSDTGVPADKIRVVFNRVEHEDDANQVFASILKYWDAERKFTLARNAVIHTSELFAKVPPGVTITQIIADDTDYKSLLKSATSAAEKQKYSRQIAVKRLATGVNNELDQVFEALFGEDAA
ncbi:MAG TPA: StbB [Gallionellaceae bacterium]|nr:StbB [Gallionellaceae bacterium]